MTNPDLVVACQGLSIQDSDFSDEQTSNLTGHTATTASQIIYPPLLPSSYKSGNSSQSEAKLRRPTQSGSLTDPNQCFPGFNPRISELQRLSNSQNVHRSLKSLGVPMLYNKLCHCTAGFGATAALCCCNELRHRFCSFHSVDQNNYSWRPLPPSPTSTMTPPPQHGSAQSCSQSVPIQRLPGFVQRHSPLIFQHDQHQNCDSCRQSKQPLIGPLYDTVLS